MEKNMTIIGITGAIGAGKGTVVDYLTKQKGFRHFSARSFLAREIESRSLHVDRDTLTMVSNDLREKYSPSYIIESLYHDAAKLGEDCIIESIRTVGEIEALRQIGHFHLLAVSAPIEIRYERIKIRHSVTDNVTFEEFKKQNEREMQSSDPHKQNLSACINLADFKIENSGNLDELYLQIELFLKEGLATEKE